MKQKDEWNAFSTSLTRDNTDTRLEAAIRAIAYLTIVERKELLKVARTCRHPYYNRYASHLKLANRFYKSTRSDLQVFEHTGLQVRDAIDTLGHFINKKPICAAILNNACRSAPFLGLSASEGDQNRTESWEKEIFACQGTTRGPLLDYTCWFSERQQDRFRSLGEHLPTAPAHNTRIHSLFSEWRDEMEGTLLFPQIQLSRNVSQATAKRYQEVTDPMQERALFDLGVSSARVERVYADFGIELQGPCEIRQLWGYNDLTPRTYFAQGGTTFHDSKYVRRPLNTLCDKFQEVNYISRYSIQDIPLDRDDTAFIYDYESFTSNLEELKYFMQRLAQFAKGTMVRLVDSREGVINCDLGDLLNEYNETCNNQGGFMVHRYNPEDFSVYLHTKAGFLGVYGNIVSSTILHGLHATQVDGDYSLAKCVGDDAFVVRLFHIAMVHQSEIFSRLQALGILHPEKTTSWGPQEMDVLEDTTSTWPYCKRPMYRGANRMIQEPNISLPILGRLCRFVDEIRCEEKEPQYELVKIAAIQTRNAFRQVRSLLNEYPVETSDLNFLIGYLSFLYARLGMPEEGSLPFESFISNGESISGVLVPPLDHRIFDEDEWNLLERRYDKAGPCVLVPRVSLDEVDCIDELVRDREAVGTSSQEISYLVNMGWASSQLCKTLASFSFDEYRRYYTKIFDGDARFLYNFELLSTCPVWVSQLCSR